MRGKKKGLQNLLVFLMCLSMQSKIMSAKDAYYMDSSMDCSFIGVNDVERSQIVSIYAKTTDISNSMQGSCTLSFRALDSDAKLKIDFNLYSITTCEVVLFLFGDASGTSKTFTCGENPSNYFSIGRSLTVTLQKKNVLANQYNFKLTLTAIREVVNISQDSNHVSAGVIIGIVGGVLAFIIIIIFCGVCCFRKYRAKSSKRRFIFDHSQKKKDVSDGIANPSMRESPAFKKKLITVSISDSSYEQYEYKKQNGRMSTFDGKINDTRFAKNVSDSYDQNGQQRNMGSRLEESKFSIPIPPPPPPPYSFVEPVKKSNRESENKSRNEIKERSMDVDLKPKTHILNDLHANSKFRDIFKKTEHDAEERAKRISSTSSLERFGEASSVPSSSNENVSRPVLPPVPKSPKLRKKRLASINRHPRPTSLSLEELAQIESGCSAMEDHNIQVFHENSTSSSIELVPIRVTDERSNIKKKLVHMVRSLTPDRNKPMKGDKKQKQTLSGSVDSVPKATFKPVKEAIPLQSTSSVPDKISSVDKPPYTHNAKTQKDTKIAGNKKRDLSESVDRLRTARTSKGEGRNSSQLGRSPGQGFSHQRGHSEENVEWCSTSQTSSVNSLEDLETPPRQGFSHQRGHSEENVEQCSTSKTSSVNSLEDLETPPRQGFSHQRGHSEENVEQCSTSQTSSVNSLEDLETPPTLKRSGCSNSLNSSRSSLHDRIELNRNGSDSVASSNIKNELSLMPHLNRGYVSDEDSDGYMKPVSRMNRERINRFENDVASKAREISAQTLRETATQTGRYGSVTFQETRLVKRKLKSLSVASCGTQTTAKVEENKLRTQSMDKLTEGIIDISKNKVKCSGSASAIVIETKDLELEKTKPVVKPIPVQLASADKQLERNTQTAQQENKAKSNAKINNPKNEGFAIPQQQYKQQSYPSMVSQSAYPVLTMPFTQYANPIGPADTAYPTAFPLQQHTVIVKGNVSQPLLGQGQPRKSNWQLLCELTDRDYQKENVNKTSSNSSSAGTRGYAHPPAGNQSFYKNQPPIFPTQTPVHNGYGNIEYNTKHVLVNTLKELPNASTRPQSSWELLKQLTSGENAKYSQVTKTNS